MVFYLVHPIATLIIRALIQIFLVSIVMALRYDKYNPARKKYSPEITLRKYLADGLLSSDDLELVRAYASHRRAVSARGSGRRAEYSMQVLAYWKRYLKVSFRMTSIADLEGAIGAYKSSSSAKGRPFSQNTQHDYISILKAFYVWLVDEEFSSIKPRQINSIKAPGINRHTTEPWDKLLAEDVLEMLRRMANPMHRALLATGWESGARPEELLCLQWLDLELDGYGYQLWVMDFKTGERRFVRLTMAAPYLADWKNASKRAEDVDHIFTTQRGGPLAYKTLRNIYFDAGVRAGLKKRVKPYGMRKGRINDMIRCKYPETAIKAQIWNNQDSHMLGTYLAQSNEEIDRLVLGHQGLLKDEDKKQDPLAKITCPYCHALNRPTARFCDQCRRALSVEMMDEQARLIKSDAERMARDPEYLADTIAELQKILATMPKK